MGKKTLTYKGVVFTWECDSNRHMNVMYYINKFEQGGHNFFMEMGILPALDEEHGFVVVDQHIKYIKEVFEDDCLYVESELLEIGNKTMTILHTMYNVATKEVVSTMKIIGVQFDKVARKAKPITDEQREKLQAWL